jgi:hypothetical protein
MALPDPPTPAPGKQHLTNNFVDTKREAMKPGTRFEYEANLATGVLRLRIVPKSGSPFVVAAFVGLDLADYRPFAVLRKNMGRCFHAPSQ